MCRLPVPAVRTLEYDADPVQHILGEAGVGREGVACAGVHRDMVGDCGLLLGSVAGHDIAGTEAGDRYCGDWDKAGACRR